MYGNFDSPNNPNLIIAMEVLIIKCLIMFIKLVSPLQNHLHCEYNVHTEAIDLIRLTRATTLVANSNYLRGRSAQLQLL